ncbi:MAG: 3-deoxy-manno-octulosonate cytidylyltransferase [Mariniblastus sp.]|nr:3-deoxy-manno-octulosonate cytidylyltransferase [Mariniblastus sp.]
MKSVIVIPARMESTRLPRKMLLAETGKTLIEHTFQAARQSGLATDVLVATDHPEIEQTVQSFGGKAVLTDPNHPSGTERLAEVAASLPEFDLFINVQGDEPEILGQDIDRVIGRLQSTPEAIVATLATPIRDPGRLSDPACVKVVMDSDGRAMYFSRSPIPMPRTGPENWLQIDPPCFFQHIGVYGYRRDHLLQIPDLPPARIEAIESLEQLRFLNAGWPVFVDVIPHAFPGIDTREGYESFVRRQANG